MNFTPNDVQNLMFRKSMMGYNEDQVLEVLDKVIEDYSEYIRENIKLRDKIEQLNDRLLEYKSIETTLQNSLVIAQQTSEDIVKNAEAKAENIIKASDMKAQQILDDANKEVIKVRFEYEQLKREMEVYRAKVESILSAQLKFLQQTTE